MKYDPAVHHRRSIRLPVYNYAQPGAYFVTAVCVDRLPLFENEAFRRVVEDAWLSLAECYEFVQLDEYIVMPNHFHGIIVLGDSRRGGSRTAPTAGRKPKALGRLVGAFKTLSTRRINQIRDTPGIPFWQRNYYERVIRNQRELHAVRQYVIDNPARWADDPENPLTARTQPYTQPYNVGTLREAPLHGGSPGAKGPPS